MADRHHLRPALPDFADQHEPRRIAQRERLKHDGVDRAEDRGRGADAERERQHRDRREAGVLAKLATREDDVLRELAEILGALHVPVSPRAERLKRRAHVFEIAEPAFRFAPCRRRVHAARDELPRSHLDVKRELLVDFVGDPRTPPDAVEWVHKQGSGLGAHVVTSIREIAAAKRVHSVACAVN